MEDVIFAKSVVIIGELSSVVGVGGVTLEGPG